MSAPISFKGIPASPGYAEGPLFDLERPVHHYVATGSPAAEATALEAAIARASTRLSELVSTLTGEAAEMLEFQLAMLADEELTGPAFRHIEDGRAAAEAWTAALDKEIKGYSLSEDGNFRAREADLRDIRDQVLRALSDVTESKAPAGAILVGHDITPTCFLSTDWTKGGGIALRSGSAASHVAMLARARGVPMVVRLGDFQHNRKGVALLDAEHGSFIIEAAPQERELFRVQFTRFAARRQEARGFLDKPAVTRDGTQIRVMVNVADPAEVEMIDIGHCDGVGLMRTEFLFASAAGLPDEETQYAAYRRVLEWAGDKPVTIRTVDAGGDKPISGFTIPETNPFLGTRGIRLSLARTDIFRVQIRALIRAAVHGDLKVMFPMVSVVEEYAEARALFEAEATRLAGAGVAHRIPPLGIMVEVPSVAIAPDQFAAAAFFSIGSNDLTQYVMAAARDNGAVAGLNLVTNPAVVKLIGTFCAYAGGSAIPVSLCGDAGGDPAAIPTLIKAGLRNLSVAPTQLAAAKAAIADVTL